MGFGFPVPVSNNKIPRGWFAALVRFMNSLLLRGDGRSFAVTHTTEGTTIKPTPALIQALERSGGAAPSESGGSGGGVIGVPDFNNPTAIDFNTPYGPLTAPVWIIGSIMIAPPYGGYTAQATLNFGIPGSGSVVSLILADVSVRNVSDPEFGLIYTPVSILIPGGVQFEVNTLPQSPSSYDFKSFLNYYPFMSN